jgi:uncharacterized small protein (DUF1192 family)
MSRLGTLVLTGPVIAPVQVPTRREHSNLALGSILDAEIEALKARLVRRSANASMVWGLARADLDPQVGWLRDSLAKLQARRNTLR